MEGMESETSGDELRAKLYRSFKDRGVLDSLKSHMRTRLATELQRGGGGSSHRAKRSPSKVPSSTEQERGRQRRRRGEGATVPLQVANSLVARHLKEAGYEYTLSVFLPETGLSMEQLFGEKDLMKYLKTSLSQDTQHEGPLVRLLEGLHSRPGSAGASRGQRSSSQASQTDDLIAEGKATIAARLQALDESYAEKMAQESQRCRHNLEERLATVQRDLDSHYKQQLALEVRLFRERELVRVRAEEKEGHEGRMRAVRAELGREHQTKMEALRRQELQMVERLRRKEQELEAGIHAQRQALLSELELLQVREGELKRQAELNHRELGLERDHVRILTEQLANKERALESRKELLEKASEEKIRKYRLQCEEEMRSKCEDIARREARLEAERGRLSVLQDAKSRLASELAEERARGEGLQARLHDVTTLHITLQREKDAMQEKLTQMLDYSQLKERCLAAESKLMEGRAEYKRRSTQQQGLIKQLQTQLSRQSHAGLVRLEAELTQLHESHCSEVAAMANDRRRLQEQLEQTAAVARASQRKAEEQMVQLLAAQREVEDLHAMLQHARAAQSLQWKGATTGGGGRSASSLKALHSTNSPSKRLPHPHTITAHPHSLTSRAHKEAPFSHSSGKLLSETRATFDRLEKEAREFEQSYQNLHTRIASPLSPPPPLDSPSPEFGRQRSSLSPLKVPSPSAERSAPIAQWQGSSSFGDGVKKKRPRSNKNDLSPSKSPTAQHRTQRAVPYSNGGSYKVQEHTTFASAVGKTEAPLSHASGPLERLPPSLTPPPTRPETLKTPPPVAMGDCDLTSDSTPLPVAIGDEDLATMSSTSCVSESATEAVPSTEGTATRLSGSSAGGGDQDNDDDTLIQSSDSLSASSEKEGNLGDSVIAEASTVEEQPPLITEEESPPTEQPANKAPPTEEKAPPTEQAADKAPPTEKKAPPTEQLVDKVPPTDQPGEKTPAAVSQSKPEPINLDELWKARKEEEASAKKQREPVPSKQPASVFSKPEPINLDELWKARKKEEAASLAAAQSSSSGREELRRRQEEEEEEAQRRKRRREEEEQRFKLELLQLAGEEEKDEMEQETEAEKQRNAKEHKSTEEKAPEKSEIPDQRKLEEPVNEEEEEEEEGEGGSKPPAEDGGIDPLMLKYMEIVRQGRRAKEDARKQAAATHADPKEEEEEEQQPLSELFGGIEGYVCSESDHDPFEDW